MTGNGANSIGTIGGTSCPITCRKFVSTAWARNDKKAMKLVIAATGASGAVYLQRLLAQIDCAAHEVHLVMSAHAREVAKQEIDDLKIPPEVSQHSEHVMKVPFVSGSASCVATAAVYC